MSNSSLLPSSVMNLPAFAVNQDNKEIIIDHLISQEGAVVLNDKQKELKMRWESADDLMRSLRYTYREVCNMLCKKFGYAMATAKRDIEDARDVFGKTRKGNKRYLLALHADRIEAAMVLAHTSGKHELLPKLFECYTNACKLLPDDDEKERNPSVIMFNITQNNFADITGSAISESEATETVAKLMAEWGVKIEDILHEEVGGE